MTVTNGGSGYATLARVEPTITADGQGGSGADITVTLTEEADFCGLPYWTITGLTVVDGGSGYTDGGEIVFTIGAGETEQLAAYALIQTSRDEPELAVESSQDSGTGATFTVAVTAIGTTPETWYISGVTVTDGGTGYTDGEAAPVGLGSGDVVQTPATLVIRTVRDEPELTLSGPADLTVNVTSLGGSPETWEITSITVNDGGSGYSDGQSLNVNLGPDDVDVGFGAYLVVNTVRAEPTLSAQAQPGSGGAGAVLAVSVVQSGDVWVVDSIAVSNGGSGYTDGEPLDILPSIGQTVLAANVNAIVSGGVITGATINGAGEFFLDTGVIDTVDVQYGGAFFKDTGVIDSIDIFFGGVYYKALGDIETISIVSGGEYYGEDASGTPHVAAVSVDLDQIAPWSSGTGAAFTVNVDDDPNSLTFGEIASITVDNGGSGYEAVGVPNQYCMGEYMNGKAFVLARNKFFNPNAQQLCAYTTYLCNPLGLGAFGLSRIVFEYRDGAYASAPQSVLVAPEVSLTTSDAIEDCSDFTLKFPADSPYFSGESPAYSSVTATVVSGGGSVGDATGLLPTGSDETGFFGPGVCGSCCLNEETPPAEVTVSIANLVEDPVSGDVPDGDYVLSRDAFWEGLFPSAYNGNATIWRLPLDIRVAVEPCAAVDYSGLGTHRAYFPDECGDTCYKKCRLKISVSGFGLVGGQYDPGCTCLDFPVCSPPAGAYTLLSGFAATPYYTATIS